MSIPKTTTAWAVHGSGPGAGSSALHLKKDQALPVLNPSDVLVKFHAASLNYRDLVSTFPLDYLPLLHQDESF